MKFSYEGIGALVVTFPSGNASEGHVCTINQQGRADGCIANKDFCGVVLADENGMAAVQLEGFVTVGYSGTKPTLGYVALVADGNGRVKLDESGKEYLVAAVNAAEMKAVIKL